MRIENIGDTTFHFNDSGQIFRVQMTCPPPTLQDRIYFLEKKLAEIKEIVDE